MKDTQGLAHRCVTLSLCARNMAQGWFYLSTPRIHMPFLAPCFRRPKTIHPSLWTCDALLLPVTCLASAPCMIQAQPTLSSFRRKLTFCKARMISSTCNLGTAPTCL